MNYIKVIIENIPISRPYIAKEDWLVGQFSVENFRIQEPLYSYTLLEK